MKRIGITGQKGFIGSHLYNTLGLFPEQFELIPFKKEFFSDETRLQSFVRSCDVIIHLAALNRHEDPEVIYETNVGLVKKLISALEHTGNKAQVIISSSSQEEKDNLYGKSKREGRELLEDWSKKTGASFTGLIIPNVFGPFGKPFYNSVVATFSHQIAYGEKPIVNIDGDLKLIYVGDLVQVILNIIENEDNHPTFSVPHTSETKVSKLLQHLENFHEVYQERGEIPVLSNSFELNLFNTYRCYMDVENYFPVKFTEHSDARGSFVEVIRLGIGGQVSFSTTVPGVTRGNHFHTRKIERFAVIKGKALIQLRQIGTDKVLNFELDGNEPAYVDMPIWYTHNIKNIGDEMLYTNFWINESYNPEDADTFFVEV